MDAIETAAVHVKVYGLVKFVCAVMVKYERDTEKMAAAFANKAKTLRGAGLLWAIATEVGELTDEELLNFALDLDPDYRPVKAMLRQRGFKRRSYVSSTGAAEGLVEMTVNYISANMSPRTP